MNGGAFLCILDSFTDLISSVPLRNPVYCLLPLQENTPFCAWNILPSVVWILQDSNKEIRSKFQTIRQMKDFVHSSKLLLQ